MMESSKLKAIKKLADLDRKCLYPMVLGKYILLRHATRRVIYAAQIIFHPMPRINSTGQFYYTANLHS